VTATGSTGTTVQDSPATSTPTTTGTPTLEQRLNELLAFTVRFTKLNGHAIRATSAATVRFRPGGSQWAAASRTVDAGSSEGAAGGRARCGADDEPLVSYSISVSESRSAMISGQEPTRAAAAMRSSLCSWWSLSGDRGADPRVTMAELGDGPRTAPAFRTIDWLVTERHLGSRFQGPIGRSRFRVRHSFRRIATRYEKIHKCFTVIINIVAIVPITQFLSLAAPCA
jgi:hypothetical protein